MDETTSPQLSPEQVEAIRANTVKEIFGDKYQGDPLKAKEGYWNLVNASSQLVQAQQQYDIRVNPGEVAAAREPATDPWAGVRTDYYGDANVLREAVRAEAAAMVAQAFEPIQQSVQARQNITEKLPDYIANEQQVIGWLKQNPEIYSLVYDVQQRGNPEAAMRLAYREFYAASNAQTSVPADKGAASIPSGGGTPPNMAPPNQGGQPNFAELVTQARRTNDPAPVYNALFANFEPTLPPHLGR